MQLLVALLNYAVLHDDFSKAAILALLADCPVDELLERRLDYLADPGDSRWLEEDDLFRKIDRVIDRNRQQSISGFVESLIVELDFENRINRWSGPEAARRRAHLDSVLALAADYETQAAQTGGASLGGFARCLEQGQMTERPFEKDPWAVSVLSYHKSKGLEWKHVILTGLERDYRKRLFAQDLFEVQLHRAAAGMPVGSFRSFRTSSERRACPGASKISCANCCTTKLPIVGSVGKRPGCSMSASPGPGIS